MVVIFVSLVTMQMPPLKEALRNWTEWMNLHKRPEKKAWGSRNVQATSSAFLPGRWNVPKERIKIERMAWNPYEGEQWRHTSSLGMAPQVTETQVFEALKYSPEQHVTEVCGLVTQLPKRNSALWTLMVKLIFPQPRLLLLQSGLFWPLWGRNGEADQNSHRFYFYSFSSRSVY